MVFFPNNFLPALLPEKKGYIITIGSYWVTDYCMYERQYEILNGQRDKWICPKGDRF